MSTQGAFTLVFDDGYTDVFNEVIPLLEKYGIRAVFAVPLSPPDGHIENEEIESIQRWQDVAKKYGHELAAHGVTHANLTTLSKNELSKELEAPARQLDSTTLVYPGGAYDEDVIAEAKKIYRAARTVQFGLETLPPENCFKLKTLNYTKNNFSLVRANMYALLAYVQQKWCIETFHMVRSAHSNMNHFVSLSDLDAHLDFLTSIPVRIATMQEVIQEYAR